MMALSLLITWLLFSWLKKISYWMLLINLGLTLIDFFFLYSKLDIWGYAVPVLLYNIYHLIIINYEIKLLAETADFLSMLKKDLTRLTMSYSLALYRDVYIHWKDNLNRQKVGNDDSRERANDENSHIKIK